MRFAFLSLLILGLISCESPKETAKQNVKLLKDSLTSEIMAVHDEVMPDHMKLQLLKDKIDERISQIEDDTVLRMKLKEISVLLDSAYRSMNSWMYEFEPMSEEMTREEILDYYRVEREKVDLVKEVMIKSLELAEQELAE